MTYVPATEAAEKAVRLLDIFSQIGCKSVPLEGIEAGVLSLWEVLENLASPGDPNDPAIADRHVAGAGVHDLAAKVVTVWDTIPATRPVLEPHIKLLSETVYTGQNVANARWDKRDGVAREQGSADKVIELYWACLCILADMSVELDDPYTSSGGRNPDVIATAADGTRWAFAIKTLSEVSSPATAAKNLVENIKKASNQIDRTDCDKGMVVVNMKNVLDHPRLRSTGAFPNWQVAQWAISAQIGNILQPFYTNEAIELEQRFLHRGKVAPIVALVAHSTALVYTPRQNQMFTELRTMIAASVPTPEASKVGTYGREATALAEDFNDLVQLVN